MSTLNPGDIIEFEGETYQVLEDQGDSGLVIPFPSEITEGTRLHWGAGAGEVRRIGNAQLPGPSPCATGGACPPSHKVEIPLGSLK